MQCTRVLYGRAGFVGRSVTEFKRLSRIAINLETLYTPDAPDHLIKFDSPAKLEELKIMCDSHQGGFSKAALIWHPETATEPYHVRFQGSISTQLPPSRPEIQRSGYAAFRTQDVGMSIFGQWFWDVDPRRYLAMKIKSDGRRYHINVQTDALVPTDIHQHRLYAETPGEWETIVVDWGAFVRTNYGMPVEPQSELMKNKVKSVGIGLIDRLVGPFDFSIAEIYATNERFGQSMPTGTEDRQRQEQEAANKRKKDPEVEKILI